MGFLHLKKSICGLSLESGSKAIGYVLLVFRVFVIILLLGLYWNLSRVVDQEVYKLKVRYPRPIIKTDGSFSDNNFGSENHEGIGGTRDDEIISLLEIKEKQFESTVTRTLFLLLLSIFDVIMLIGVYKRRPSLIFTWVIVHIITTCLAIIQLIKVISGTAGLPILYIISSIVCTIYFTLVVNSHHHNLKKGSSSPTLPFSVVT